MAGVIWGKMEVINLLDERNRIRGIQFHNNGLNRQSDSHGYSYVCLRELKQDIGEKMGFDEKYSELVKVESVLPPRS